MRKVSIILVLIMLSIVGSNVYGDLLIVTIKESELPFDLSPSNYDNSPSPTTITLHPIIITLPPTMRIAHRITRMGRMEIGVSLSRKVAAIFLLAIM